MLWSTLTSRIVVQSLIIIQGKILQNINNHTRLNNHTGMYFRAKFALIFVKKGLILEICTKLIIVQAPIRAYRTIF